VTGGRFPRPRGRQLPNGGAFDRRRPSWPRRPPTFDHLRKKPLEQRVRVYLDDDVIEALNDARAET
jgi:hypothetical protein